jgi:hypothetical protein
MTTNELKIAVAEMGIRKNNTLMIGSFVVEKWRTNQFKLTTVDGTHIGVADLAWLTKKLQDNGAIK